MEGHCPTYRSAFATRGSIELAVVDVPRTPDGRYIVVSGSAGPRLWRASNPALTESRRVALVKELSAARRAVRAAKDDAAARASARAASG
jgi:hypothetical protein